MIPALRALSAAALMFLLAGAARADPPLWVLHGPQSTVILFGSVHLLPSGGDWEPARLKASIAQADDLWFEIPIDDAASLAAQRAALAQGFEPQGVTLRGQLPPTEQTHLEQIAARYGLSVEGLDRLKPWLAEVTLSLAVYRQAGAAPEDGVERTLSAAAPPGLARHAFETPEAQIGYLAQTPAADQVASLEETLGELDQGAASYQRLVAAWEAGDAHAIATEAVDPLKQAAPGVYRALVTERNQRWVRMIKDRLKRPGLCVMVVGVGHLVGPDSVPAMLRAEGLSVEGP